MEYQAIMFLVFNHLTYEEITASVGCSRRDVSAVNKAMGAAGITAERFASMTAADTELLFPDGREAVSQDYADAHFAQLIAEMKHNRFFTLQQGWVKYLGTRSERTKYSYSQYCELFNRFAAVTDVVATLQHEPGKAMLVDWAGPSLPVVDPNSVPTRRKCQYHLRGGSGPSRQNRSTFRRYLAHAK